MSQLSSPAPAASQSHVQRHTIIAVALAAFAVAVSSAAYARFDNAHATAEAGGSSSRTQPSDTQPDSQPVAPNRGVAPGLASENDTSGLRLVTLHDDTLNLPAMTLHIPAGWRLEGGIDRNVPCSPGDAFPHFHAQSSDGSISIQQLTPFFTSSQPQPNFERCGVITQLVPTTTLLTRYIVPALARGMNPGQAEPIPGSAAMLQQMNQRDARFLRSGDTGRIHLTFTSPTGRPMEEYITGISQITRIPGYGGTSITPILILSAPAGQLDHVIETIASRIALTPLPEWQRQDQELTAQARDLSDHNGQARAGIVADGQRNSARLGAVAAGAIDNINRTGNASSNAAAASEQVRHDAAIGTAAHVGDKTISYKWCDSRGNFTYTSTTYPPAGSWQRCN